MGAWSTVCPVHTDGSNRCTKSLSVTEEVSMEDALRKLMHWANQSVFLESRAAHMNIYARELDILPMEELEGNVLNREDLESLGITVPDRHAVQVVAKGE